MDNHNLYSGSVILSNIELYYTESQKYIDNEISLTGDEFKHAVVVMRHHAGDEIFVTDGNGKIFRGLIREIRKELLLINVIDEYSYENRNQNIFFCIPKLKNHERFEFALEKCTELGITNFIVFESERTVSGAVKLGRWNKILLSAMKQSLRSFLPKISIADSVNNFKDMEGSKLIFEQNSEKYFNGFKNDYSTKYYFVFGPEGGFTKDEINTFDKESLFKIADNRLRTETAIIKCASFL